MPKRNIDLGRRAEIGREKRLRTRQQVLDAAFALLGRERGLTTRIEEICEAASISRGTFYNYFTSIEDLFDALSYDLNHDFNDAVTAIINEMPDGAERVSAAVRYYLDRALKDSQWAWAMVHISAGGPIFGAETYACTQHTANVGILSGAFADVDPDSARDLQLGATLAAMITQLRHTPSATYAVSVARNVLRGLGVSKDRVEDIVRKPLPDPKV